MKVNKLVASIFSYSTESEQKVVQSLNSLLGNIEGLNVIETKVTGHYGDPILTYRVELEGKQATAVTERIISKLDKGDIVFLLSTLESRSQGNRIYLRIDKQELISRNRVVLKDGEDVIKITISLKDDIAKFREVLRQIASGNLYT
ncbi:MAG: RNA-binding domain-containing protein [Metallosphaera sp.]|uniref:Exosome protein n=1 Tax=Metallosphaera cuprina (strain Ar-4) TaxID=1006006 RepID=F4G1T0_METCR|nr:RNA-binding domain-containing protein [Metallosphaera cuprina]AEB96087.1 conserved hypothetical protein [Metallosphaera cuprina Ar-4]